MDNTAKTTNKKNNDIPPVKMTREEIRASGMRMFANVMLRAWRARQAEYKNLMNLNLHLKETIFNTNLKIKEITELTKNEKEHNERVAIEIQNANDDIALTQKEFNKLQESADKIKMRKLILMKDYDVKCKECENIYSHLNQIKCEINQVLLRQEQLQKAYIFEKKKAADLEKENATIVQEIQCIKQVNMESASVVNEKRESSAKTAEEVKRLKEAICQSRSNIFRLKRAMKLDSVMDGELKKLNWEISEIQAKERKFKVLMEYLYTFFTFNSAYLLVAFFLVPHLKIKQF